MAKILIVDDDAELRANIREVLVEDGHETFEAADGSDALAQATSGNFNIILLDVMMPNMSGMDILPDLKKNSPRSKIIMITAFATVGNAVEAIKKGACDYISKPFKIDELLITINRALEESKFENSLKNLDFDSLLGALTNPIRREILHFLDMKKKMRLMELSRELKIEDHTKVIFHLKMLREAGIIKQNDDKAYVVTGEGNKTIECLKVMKKHLTDEGNS